MNSIVLLILRNNYDHKYQVIVVAHMHSVSHIFSCAKLKNNK